MMDLNLLQRMIGDGYVNVQKHPQYELFIYNYSAKTQYDYLWNDVTKACRGLIMDAEMSVVARPFAKFFNLEEADQADIPNLPFDVFEKMDGSLGILYWAKEQAFIATRGSFSSDQANKANQILHSKYAAALAQIDRAKTYLFEIIYPDNRIVVDYGNSEALVLIAVIDTASGQDLPLEDIGFPVVRQYHGINDWRTLKAMETDNHEGFVIRFQNGQRFKVKFEEYLRLHRIVTHVSSTDIWEHLAAGIPLDEYLEHVPDEFYHWVKATSQQLQNRFEDVENQCKSEFKALPTRKESAEYFAGCAYPNVLFKMLDGRPYEDVIWRMIKPEFQKAFSVTKE